ncbi:MAG: UPF0175 family protein [Candidatus Zhuqueibacterota bacterium]
MSLIIPDEVVKSTRMSLSELSLEIAVMLFQKGKLTLGQASQLADISQYQFQHLLLSRKIPVHYDELEFEADVKTLKELN